MAPPASATEHQSEKPGEGDPAVNTPHVAPLPKGESPAGAPSEPAGNPALIAAHTQSFVDVSQGLFSPGDYCLTPAPGVDVTDTAAVVSEEAFYSNAAGFVTVRYPTVQSYLGDRLPHLGDCF